MSPDSAKNQKMPSDPYEISYEILDISPLVHEKIAVFPGDTPFQKKLLASCDQGDHFGLSSITTTPHLGAHVDAPNHYAAREAGIDQRSLSFYFGKCQVIEVNIEKKQRITQAHIKKSHIQAPRVLFKTNSFPNSELWNNDFNALSVDLIEYLAGKNVILVGIDTPSIDLAEAKILEAHHCIYKNDMAILEGIDLSKVPEGIYTLSALPLKLKDLDASPVRAVLIRDLIREQQKVAGGTYANS